MKNQKHKTTNRIIPVFFTLAFILASQFCRAQNAYITNNGDNTVSVIDLATNTVIDTIAVGAQPQGVSVSADGSKVYIANNGDNTVSVINTATNTLSATIPVGTAPFGISVTPDGSKVYVANSYSYTVSAINTATNTVSATISVGNYPFGMCISPDGGKVYVTNLSSNSAVHVINTTADTVSATILLLLNDDPSGVSVSPDGSEVYVANSGSASVSVINTATNFVSARILVGNYPHAFGNFISTCSHSSSCGSNFSIAADTTQLHHYIVTNNAFGKQPISYVWSWGDGTHDTIPYPSHTYADSGFYDICLSITDSTGCQSTYCDSSFHALRTTNTMVYVNVVNPLAAGIQTLNSQTPLVILYPNPATNQLTIHSSYFHSEAVTVSVVNILGQMMQEEKTNWTSDININIKTLSSGIYFLQMKTENGSAVKKFVKE